MTTDHHTSAAPNLLDDLHGHLSDIDRLNSDQTHPLQRILNSLPQSVFWKDRNLRYLGCNQRFARDAGMSNPEDLIGKSDYDMPWQEQAELYRSDDQRIMASGTPQYNYEEPQTQSDGNTIWLRTSKIPLRDASGAVAGILGMYEDVTEQKRAESERARLQEQLIHMQAASLAELSTPLIPISDQVVIMPLIGAIDSRRAQQVLDTLLHGISQSGARFAILDITGVTVVDTQVANALLRAAQAVQLLGAQAILTGIRPEVAQTLVGLGASLGSIITRGTLQSGIAYAIDQN
jgi:PAS domain S-box-containing protein